MNHKTCLIAGLAIAAFSGWMSTDLAAQNNPARTSDLSDEDWTAWRVGVLTSEEADKAYLAKDFANAAALYQKAMDQFLLVRKNKPYWNKKGINNRLALLERKLAAANRRKDDASQAKPQGTASEDQRIAAVRADAVAEMAELKVQIAEAQKQAMRYKENMERAEKAAKQVEVLMREREEMEKKYALLLIQYNEAKTKAESKEADQVLKDAIVSEKKTSAALGESLKKVQGDLDTLKKTLEASVKEKVALEASVKDLNKKLESVDRLEKEIASLQARIAAQTTDSEKLQKNNQNEIKRLAGELAAKSRQADEANEALNKLRASMNLDTAARQLEQTVASLRAENDGLQKEVAKLRTDLEKIRNAGAETNDTVARTQALAKNLTEQNKHLSAEIDKAKKLLDTRSGELRVLSENLAKVQSENAKLTKERNAFADQIAKKQAETSTVAAAELAQANAKLKAAADENKKISDVTKQLTQTVEQQSKKSEDLQKEVAKAKDDLKKAQAEIAKLLSKDTVLKEVTDQKKEAEKKLADSEKALSAKTAEIAQLQKNLKEASGKLDAAKELDQKLKKAQDEQAALNKTLADVNADLAAKKKIISESQFAERKELTQEVEKLKALLADSQKKIAELQALNGSSVKMEQELRNTRNAILVLESEKAALISEKEQMSKTLAYHESKAKEYSKTVSNEALLKSVLQENHILKIKLENAQKVTLDDKAAKELNEAKANAAAVQTEYNRTLEELAQLKNHQLELRLQITEMQKQLNAVRDENAALKKNPDAKAAAESRNKMQLQLTALEDQVKAKDAQIRELENRLAELVKEQTAQTRAEAVLKQEKQALEAKLNSAAPSIKTLEAKVADLEKKMGEKVAENERLQRALASNGKTVEPPIVKTVEVPVVKTVTDPKLQAEKDALAKDLAKVKEDLAAAQKQLKEAQDVAANTAASAKSSEKLNAAQQKELAKAKEDLAAREKELTEAQDAAASAKTSEDLNAAQKELAKAKEDLAAREKELAEAKKTLKDTEESMAKSAAQSKETDSPDLAKLREENTKLNGTISLLTKERDAFNDSLTETKKELLSVKAQLEKLRTEIMVNEKAQALEKKLGAAEVKNAELERKYADAQKSLMAVSQKCDGLVQKATASERELADAKETITSLRKEVKQWSAGSGKMVQKQLSEKDQIIDKIVKEHVATSDELERTKVRLADTGAVISAQEKTIAALNKEIKRLNEQLEIKPATETVTTGVTMTASGRVLKNEDLNQQEQPTAVASQEQKPAKVKTPEAKVKTPETAKAVKKEVVLTAEQKKQYEENMALGAKLEKANELDEAMWKYLLAADADKNAWQPVFAQAKLYLKAKKFDKAQGKYKNALALDMKRDEAFEAELKKIEPPKKAGEKAGEKADEKAEK